MGRIRTNLGAVRKQQGVRAAELAEKVGVSRQTIYAIEAGNYLPNTEITLRISRELRVAVEELFALREDETDRSDEVTGAYLGRGTGRTGQPVRVGRVGRRWVSVPADSRPYHLPEADAVLEGAPKRRKSPRIRLLSGEEAIGQRIVLAGCDPATSLLARTVERHGDVEVVHAPGSSRLALEWLKDRRVHIAGSHLEDPRSAEYNLPFVRRRFRNRDMAVITFACWEEGFVVASGNPRRIRNVDDLQREDLALMNREPGSGSRELLDGLMKESGLERSKVHGYDHVAYGHLAAAEAVFTGRADCCVATRSAAQAFGLGFVPLRTEQYDFVVDRSALDLPAIQNFFNVLSEAPLRRKLEALAGYDTSQTGAIRA